MRIASVIVFACATSIAAAAPPNSPNAPASAPPAARSETTQRVVAGRNDLARAYLAFERAMDERPPDAARRAETNEAVDRLTALFFAGRNAEAIAALDETTATVLGLEGEARRTYLALAAQRATIDPRELVVGASPHVRVVFASLVPGMSMPRGATVVVTGPDGSTFSQPANDVVRLDSGEHAKGGRYVLALAAPGLPRAVDVGDVCVLQRPVDAIVADLNRRLDALDAAGSGREIDRAATRSRVALLVDRGSKSAALLANRATLADEVRNDVAMLERGESPWIGRRGEAWRTLRVNGADFPLRVLVPENLPRDAKPPLVIAFHGFGGDENMFLTGYGNGLLGKLARERGFVVACPVTSNAMLSPALVPAIVDELATTANVDRSRVFVLGHSMGCGAAERAAESMPDRLAGVVLIAGGGPRRNDGPPRLVVRAGKDRIVPARPMTTDDGATVYADEGHLLVVSRALPDAVTWMLERTPRGASTSGTE